MKLPRIVTTIATILFIAGFLVATNLNSVADTNHPVIATRLPPPLPAGVLLWDATTKQTSVAADAGVAHFTFLLTNASTQDVTISDVHPSCGCTTAELPPLPWTLAPGANGQIGARISIASKSGTLYKSIAITTDKGLTNLTLIINILPPTNGMMSAADRERNLLAAKVNRQAVFHGDCANCHVKAGEGKVGKALFDADCGICHEGPHRALMVPDLHAIPQATDVQFWRTWIAHGRPDSLMPAFSQSEGGPLTDAQIGALANYLNATIPSKASK